MSTVRYLLVALAVLGATVAVVGLGPILLVVAVLLWAWRRWRRPKAEVPPPPPLPIEPLCHTWGYVIPLRAVVTEWVPGYVGLTRRAPTELPDGRLWCKRWEDDDHVAKRGLLDYDRAEVIYVADTWGKARVWEDATIDQYVALGAPLLNEQGNPYR